MDRQAQQHEHAFVNLNFNISILDLDEFIHWMICTACLLIYMSIYTHDTPKRTYVTTRAAHIKETTLYI